MTCTRVLKTCSTLAISAMLFACQGAPTNAPADTSTPASTTQGCTATLDGKTIVENGELKI